METDLKGKVGAAALTAAQSAHPGARPTLARHPGRLPPLLPRREGAESREVRARGGSTHPLTRTHARIYILTCTQMHTDTARTVATQCSHFNNYTLTHTNKSTHTHKYTAMNSVTIIHTNTILIHTKLCTHIYKYSHNVYFTQKYIAIYNYTLTQATTHVHTHTLTQTHTLTNTNHTLIHALTVPD